MDGPNEPESGARTPEQATVPTRRASRRGAVATPPRGVFFVHVMKTGGGSLGEAIGAAFAPEDRYPDVGGTLGPFAKTVPGLLMQVREQEQRPRAFYSVHMPAWVADEVAPDHLRVTVLRDPVARTISHLRQLADLPGEDRSLEEVYDDPVYRDRLVGYQVRVFAERAAKSEMQVALEQAVDEGATLPSDFLRPILATGVGAVEPLPDDALERAIATLDRFDVVGVTEHLDRAAEQVGRRLGLDLPPPGWRHPGGGVEVSDELRERIRAEHALETRLYEHARALALGPRRA